ncbi:hypothetical protein LH23_14280 [Cedecea neteri]|uniref:Uncharacterized protein n=1 Tax=Cedecea neteri TaxID=158822 RepID=A0AAN0VTX4_9ENTR|nr:hypothetical protein [Cedecea neteri]AIR61777.1 hypothetical protein LH23_14280 [Cedecea neteri]
MKNIELIHSLTKLVALIIIAVVIVFIILGLLIIFPSKDAYSFSNITDILSALSTFGTLVVAYMAYKAAPDWLQNKKKEEGLKHVTELMAGYEDCSSKIMAIHSQLVGLNTQSPDYPVIKNEIANNAHQIIDLIQKLTSCSRWKITYIDEVRDSFSRLLGFYNQSHVYLILLDTHANNHNIKLLEDISNLRDKIASDATILKSELDTLFTFHK